MIQRMMVLLLLCASLSACSQGRLDEGQLDIRDAYVERIEIEILETEPAQVQVTAYGNFISGCMTLHETEQRREGNTFFVKITVAEPAGESCPPVAPPFTETVMLDGEFSSGTYTVDVNGVTETFTLP